MTQVFTETNGSPQVLLAHHLKQLKLPTFLREHEKVAREAAQEEARPSALPYCVWRNSN